MTFASHLRRAHYSRERWGRLYARAMRLYMRRTGWRPTAGPLLAVASRLDQVSGG